MFLIASYLDSTFNRKTFDLRDKTAIRVDRDKLDALEVATPERTVRFAKANNEWQLTAPTPGRADFSAVEGLTGRVAGLQMKAIAEAEPADLKKYGLDKPTATVRLARDRRRLRCSSAPRQTDDLYARDTSRPAVFTIDASLIDDLKKDPFEYRQKDLFDARSFNSTRVEVVRAGQSHAFEKIKSKDKDGKEEEKWRQDSPQARDVDQAKVEALLGALTGAQATALAPPTAKAALDKPELTAASSTTKGARRIV